MPTVKFYTCEFLNYVIAKPYLFDFVHIYMQFIQLLWNWKGNHFYIILKLLWCKIPKLSERQMQVQDFMFMQPIKDFPAVVNCSL